jgi:hypothetical protein
MKLKYLNWLLILLIAGACGKENSDDLSGFDVKTDGLTFKAGEEVTFKLSGNPSQLAFYSGEILKDYSHKDGRVVEAGCIQMSFSSRVQYGVQPNQFSVLASVDFNGKYTIDDIKAATWTNISDKFALGTDATYIYSGVVNLNDLLLVEEGKPLYLVFKYVYEPSAGVGRSWYVQNFSLKSQTVLGLTTLFDQNSAGWQLVSYGPKEQSTASVSTTTILLRANSSNPTIYAEEWCISKPIYVSSVDVGPDWAAPIKGYSDKMLTEYKYVYNTPGNYRATFVAGNKTASDNEEMVKYVDITIVP